MNLSQCGNWRARSDALGHERRLTMRRNVRFPSNRYRKWARRAGLDLMGTGSAAHNRLTVRCPAKLRMTIPHNGPRPDLCADKPRPTASA
jgi:hypothetical protein